MFSKRVQQIPGSPTVALNSKAKALKAAGHRVFNFTIGEPDFVTPQPVTEAAIIALKNGQTKYGAPGGGQQLREAFADKLRRENSLEYSPSQIVCGMGAKELLFHTALALLDKGDKAIVMAPYWVSYPAHICAAEGTPIVIPPPNDFGRERIDFDQIEKALTENIVKLIYLNSPNNPSGYVFTSQDLSRLAVLLRKFPETIIITDEIYEYLTYGHHHLSLLQVAPDLKERTIIIHGLAKNFAMTGWRVGFAAAPQEIASVLTKLQSQSSTCLPGFIESAAVLALENGRDLVQNELQAYERRRELILQEVKKIPNVEAVTPEGAFYLFLNCKESIAQLTDISSTNQLAEILLTKYFIATVPGEAFGTPGYLRLSFSISEPDILEGINHLREAFKDLAAQSEGS